MPTPSSLNMPVVDCVRSSLPELSVIVPCFNESATVQQAIARVLDAPYDKEIVIVDDGSTDGTTDILARFAVRPDVTIITLAANHGKGFAIRTALNHARGRFVIIQDADLEVDPQDYPLLVEPLIRGEADAVLGSRWRRCPRGRPRWSLHRLAVSLLNLAVFVLYRKAVSDEACCFKATTTDCMRAMKLESNRFEFCPEFVAKACRMKLRLLEVPVRYSPRTRAQGKKIRIWDGWKALLTLWRLRCWRP